VKEIISITRMSVLISGFLQLVVNCQNLASSKQPPLLVLFESCSAKIDKFILPTVGRSLVLAMINYVRESAG